MELQQIQLVLSLYEILLFNEDEKCMMHCFGSSGSDDGQFNHPYTVAIAPNGLLYVTDYDNCRVQIF